MDEKSAEKAGASSKRDKGTDPPVAGGDASGQVGPSSANSRIHNAFSRFRRRRPGRYSGQGGINPCLCFSWCCRGTCTLLTGCFVIGLYEIIIGVVKLLYKITTYVIYINYQPGHVRRRWDSFQLLDFVLHLPPAILQGIQGTILLAATFKLSQILCSVYVVMSFIEMVFEIFMCGILTYSIPDHEPAPDPYVEVYYLTGLWVGAFINLFTAIYTILCTYCFKLQIKDKEYELPPTSTSSNVPDSPPPYHQQALAKNNPYSSPT